MEIEKDCKVSSCYRSHGCKIFGIIFLIIATILTLITLNGAGILGMFIVGIALLCCHHKDTKGCGCGCKTCGGTEEVKSCYVEEKVEQNPKL